MGIRRPRGVPPGDSLEHPEQPMRYPGKQGEDIRLGAVSSSLAASAESTCPDDQQHLPDAESRHPRGRRHQRQLQQQRHLEALVEGQSQVLEMIAQGLPLDQILEAIVRWVEAQSRDGVVASLLLLDHTGQRLQHGAAPSLPQTYNDAIHGLHIGPAVGSCGTAAFVKHEIVVEDISADPLWADFRELALSHGLRACWSTPLIGRTGNVLGTFALYYRQPRRPTAADRHLIRLVTRTATLAIERKQADEATAHLAAIVTSAKDAIVSKTLEGIVTSWNASAERMFGYSAGEMIGQPILRLFPPDRLDEEDQIMRRIRAGERIEHFETVRLTKDGRHLDVSLTISPMRDSAGTIIGASKIVRDISERKRLERRTREALDALLELAAAMVSDPEPTGDGPEVGDGNRLQEVNVWRGSDSAQRTDDIIRDFATLCGRVLGCEQMAIITIESETGLLRTVALTGSTPEQERRFRAGIADLRLAERFGSQIAAHLLAGETALVDVGQLPMDDPASILSRRLFLVAPIRAAGVLQGYIGVNFGDESDQYTVENRALALAVAHLVGIVMERARLTREREEARAREAALAQAKRQMDEFLSIASHELRTPLTAVSANIQLASRSVQALSRAFTHEGRSGESAASGSEDAREVPVLPVARASDEEAMIARAALHLQRTEQQVQRLDRLMDDLLDISRINAGRLELRLERCDLLTIARDCVEAHRATWPDRVMTLDCDLPPGETSVLIDADPDRMGQVVTNFLTNALKYSAPDQPVAVRVGIVRGGRENGGKDDEGEQDDSARLEVRDHGPGLSAEQQAHLFERFYRVPGIEQQSAGGVGLGLGLYICRTIIERHGGTIGVDSELGAGSTFWCTLPLPPDGAERPHPAPPHGAL